MFVFSVRAIELLCCTRKLWLLGQSLNTHLLMHSFVCLGAL